MQQPKPPHLPPRLKQHHVVSIFVLFLLLFTFPVLGMFNKPLRVAGVPLLYLYVFGVWLSFVLLAALLQRRHKPGATGGERSADDR